MFLSVVGLFPLSWATLGAKNWLPQSNCPWAPQADCSEGRWERVFVQGWEGSLGTCTSDASLQTMPPPPFQFHYQGQAGKNLGTRDILRVHVWPRFFLALKAHLESAWESQFCPLAL